MIKSDLTQLLYEELDHRVSRPTCTDLVNAVFFEMKAQLIAGHDIKLSGFGKFVVKDKAKRIGRNPQTGEPIEIAARRIVTFKASERLKNTMNE